MNHFVLQFILLSVSIATFVECSLFSSTDLYIASKPVIIFSNGTTIDFLATTIRPKDFKSGIIPFDNLTQPATSGLEGTLYDRGDSCQINSSFLVKRPVISTERKIALVNNKGDCSFYDKVYNSELDGADGVIIYDDKPFRDDDTSGSNKIPRGNLKITMYYVDLFIGLELYKMLQDTAYLPINTTSDNTTYQPAISLVMHPAVGGFPSAWEFTLIIVVALLAISFLASVGMHWHLWRIRRRQRALFESGLLDMNNAHMTQQSTRKIIDPASLSLFPTRIIGDEPNLELSRVESNRSIRSSKAIENAQLLQSTISVTTPSQDERPTSVSTPAPQHHESSEEACVICLDEFSLGEQVRKLPCGHEYHCECIDPWLTIKSASCPLCKHDCSVDVPKTEQQLLEEEEQQQRLANVQASTPPPPSYTNSFFSSLPSFRSSHNNSPTSSFGPTIAADRAEEFSRSWMARSLPRNMRRQIHEAAAAAAAANRESVIELPARMTANVTPEPADTTIRFTPVDYDTHPSTSSSPPPLPSAQSSSFGGRLRRKFPKLFQSNTNTSITTTNNTHY